MSSFTVVQPIGKRSALLHTPLWPAGHLPHKRGEWQLWSRRFNCHVEDWRKPWRRLFSPLVGEMAGRPESGPKEHIRSRAGRRGGNAALFSRAFALAFVLAGTAVLGACRDSGRDALFEISGRLVVFNYREATLTYLVTLNPLKPVGEGQSAVTTMDNPAGGAPLVFAKKLFPGQAKVTIESPPLECVVKDRPYKVSIRIEGPDTAVLQDIETTMVSAQDQSMLPDRPLVVGPGYQPNPELAGRPDGRLPGGRGVVCPATG